ncbi:site-specific integrase [Granulicatella seriolae]|uniref:Site-specific integrase n=1 Tax=Granulicatella seriolae TaxID=2967226 RepID=A0ABT1WN54_9LACT|nr:site-specific integrase [Granulicatella seriolae]
MINFIDNYIKSIQKDYARSTIKQIRTILHRYASHTERTGNYNQKTYHSFIEKLMKTCNKNTIAYYQRILNKFMTEFKNSYPEQNVYIPFEVRSFQYNSTIPDFFLYRELMTIKELLTYSFAVEEIFLYSLCLYQGFSTKDIKNLNYKHFCFQTYVIDMDYRIAVLYNDQVILLKAILMNRSFSETSFFLNQNRRAMQDYSIRRILKKIGEIKHQNLTPRILRNSFIIESLNSEISEAVIVDYLGLSSIKNICRYTTIQQLIYYHFN